MTECNASENPFQDGFFPNVKTRRIEVEGAALTAAEFDEHCFHRLHFGDELLRQIHVFP